MFSVIKLIAISGGLRTIYIYTTRVNVVMQEMISQHMSSIATHSSVMLPVTNSLATSYII